MADDNEIIRQTQAWVRQLIVKYNICPFARREIEWQSIRYTVWQGNDFEATLDTVVAECRLLDRDQDTETTLLMLPDFASFNEFLDLIAVSEQLLSMSGYSGVYQLAHFHPDYCFAGEQPEDPANYTNRAPFPTLHFLREESMAGALMKTENAEQIPQRNIEFARRKGAEFFKQILADIAAKQN
ncbi:DUF1415 domain-containing protein [Idiomarina seosinensis]|uniref:DUF1415 domain-containing protein n=1 Tax=Idiomarina seosinensis TaxID=281739 RepID=UPI00384AB2F1